MNFLRNTTTILSPLMLAGIAASQFTVLPPSQSNGIAPSSAAPLRHWDLRNFPACTVPYRVNNAGCADFPAQAPVVAEIDKAFAVWRNVEPAVIDFANLGGTAARGNVADGNNVVFWDNALCSGDAWDASLRGGSIALTFTMSNAATGIISDVDIVFDDEHFNWNVGLQALTLGADDVAGAGATVREPGAGGNGTCDTAAVCDDVQVVPVGAAVVAGGICVGPGANGVLSSVPGLSGSLDIWAIAAHEVGHLCGLGENNAVGTGAERTETTLNAPFLLPAPAALTFTVDGVAFVVPLPAGAITAAALAAAINAVIPGPVPVAAATATGDSVRITATNPASVVVITAGGAEAALGMVGGESGISTMNQPDPRGFTSTDQRSLARCDMDGLNFLYSPDLGDAPVPYPTTVHAGNGPIHLFGIYGGDAGPRYQYEWLGQRIDDHAAECEARIPDMDEYDDGVVFFGAFGAGGGGVLIDVTVSTGVDILGGSHTYTPLNPLYLNAWFDWNADGDWDDAGEHVIGAAAGSEIIILAPGTSVTLPFFVMPPPAFIEGGYSRFRLDWGEDVNQVGRIDPTLNLTRGTAQFGEVEDYPIPFHCMSPGPIPYCQAGPNSVNFLGAQIDFQGSIDIGANNFVLKCQLVPNQPGLFYYGGGQIQQPFGNGFRCVSPGTGGIYRLGVVIPQSGADAVWTLDFSNPPEPNSQIHPGSTWNFQYWYRDPAGGGHGFNLSNALQVTFCP
ncbi:MAG: hypothetical protein ACI835_002240 [Planctomycetota bacterium]|jgi:hypothetical protein